MNPDEPELRPIHNRPVIPDAETLRAEASAPPVTREDLGADFRNALYFGDLGTPIARQSLYDAKLGRVVWTQWYGNAEAAEARRDASRRGESAPDWEHVARDHADRGLFVIFNSLAASEISKEHHSSLVEWFGPRFLGHDEGEWDGAYISLLANRDEFSLSPERSRREACEHYLQWMGGNYRRHCNRMVTCSSLLFGLHYAAELGSRMLGLELGERLPCDTLMLAFCRGACKQYGLLMMTFPAVYSIRGVKLYPLPGQPQSIVMGGHPAGPEHGATLGLLKRLWWCSYMNGASIIGLQSGYFPVDMRGAGDSIPDPVPMEEPVTGPKLRAHLTPLGRLLCECEEGARTHPARGVPYTPVAVMLHHDHGWYPHPNIYARGKAGCVWGNIPHDAGDRQIERFFEWVYPGFRLAATHRDERGKMVNTPFGDIFDVILSNANEDCLAKYQTVVLLGSWNVSSEPGLVERLEAFVREGRTIIANVGQWRLPSTGQARPEPGPMRELVVGKGRMLLAAMPEQETRTARTGVFGGACSRIAEHFQALSPVAIEGRPIYHLVNVTHRPDELVVTLCNNSHALPWEGVLRIRGQEIVEVEEWLAFGEAHLQAGSAHCGVPPNDVRVFRIRTHRGFLPLRFGGPSLATGGERFGAN